MREMLFRGKSIVADSPNTPGHWLEGFYISRLMECDDALVNEIHIIERNHYINIYLDSDTEVWPETVGQYTGLKDCDGRKIFEGDIIRCQDIVGKIDWNETHLAITILARNKDSSMQYYFIDEGLGSDITIIGNIHDNPEMVEGVK